MDDKVKAEDVFDITDIVRKLKSTYEPVKFIKSSVRTKPDPLYYKRIIDRLQPKRDELLNKAEAAGDIYESDPESEFRREANRLSAKISWAITQLGVAIRMVADQKGAVS